MKTVNDLVTTLEGWLNYLEKKNGTDLGDMTDAGKKRNAGYNNYTLYAKWYKESTGENYQGQAYCAMAVSCAFVETFGLSTARKLLGGDLYYNCQLFYDRIKAKYPGRLHKTPAVGDVVLFDNGKKHNHTGVVVKVTSGGFVTIEANTSSGNGVVIPNGGATTRKSYTLSATRADFYRPPYAELGISVDGKTEDLVTYPIGTGQGGLRVTASSLRVRALPSTDSPQTGSLANGAAIYPDAKAFDERGVRWYRIPEGWVSGAYLTGWILEKGNNRWWYLLEGDTWYTGTLAVIDGAVYAFDDSGYMITDPVEVTPDSSGALHLK